MYAIYIYGNIYHQYTPNVSIYTIHGSYGLWDIIFRMATWYLILVPPHLTAAYRDYQSKVDNHVGRTRMINQTIPQIIKKRWYVYHSQMAGLLFYNLHPHYYYPQVNKHSNIAIEMAIYSWFTHKIIWCSIVFLYLYQRVNIHFPMGFPIIFPLKPPFSYGFPIIFPLKPPFSYGFTPITDIRSLPPPMLQAPPTRRWHRCARCAPSPSGTTPRAAAWLGAWLPAEASSEADLAEEHGSLNVPIEHHPTIRFH